MALKNLVDGARGGGAVLLAVAAPREAEAVLRGLGSRERGVRPWERIAVSARVGLVLTGVGKANAAGAVARALGEDDAGVLSLGLAGALPGSGLSPGSVVVAESAVLADEGVAAEEEFLPLTRLGFPAMEGIGERFETDEAWRGTLSALADRVGRVATVSACSGTDAAAAEIARRTGAVCEDMESAAVGLVAARLGVAFACVRVVSNRTGRRESQGWDLSAGFAGLERVAASL